MPAYVLTGAPGAGKTAILGLLERDGFGVIAEAATDVIAAEQALGCDEPWHDPGFTARIVSLQRQREPAAGPGDAVVFADRSPACTLALARFLGHTEPPLLLDEVRRVVAARVYAREVFLVRGLGFVTPTAARRISPADALRFEAVHEQTYAELGYRLIEVPPGPLHWRAALIRQTVAALG